MLVQLYGCSASSKFFSNDEIDCDVGEIYDLREDDTFYCNEFKYILQMH